jgi:HEAT repeat protein
MGDSFLANCKYRRNRMVRKSSSELMLTFSAVLIVLCAAFFIQPGIVSSAQKESSEGKAIQVAKQSASVKKETKVDPKDKPGFFDEIYEATKDENVSKRVLAVLKLRQAPSLEALNLLAIFMADPDPAVITEAIDTTAYIGMNSAFKDQAYDLLEQKAKDKEYTRRGMALIAAARLGKQDRVLPIIKSYIAEEDDGPRRYATRAMSFVSTPECTPLLDSLLKECEDAEVQRNALIILARLDDKKATEILKKNLSAPRGDKQTYCAWALSTQNRPVYNKMLMDAMISDHLGKNAIAVVARGKAAPSVFGVLLARKDISPKMKIKWMKIIAENGKFASGSVRAAVGEILEPAITDANKEIEIQGIKTLGVIGAGEEASDILIPKLKSEDIKVRKEALVAYAQYITPWNYKPVLHLYWDEDKKIRRTAFVLTEKFLGISDKEVLEKAAKHEDTFIAKHTGKILEQMNAVN